VCSRRRSSVNLVLKIKVIRDIEGFYQFIELNFDKTSIITDEPQIG